MSRTINYILLRLYTMFLHHRFAHLGRNSHIGWHAMKLIGLKYISIGDGTYISPNIQLTAWESHNGNR